MQAKETHYASASDLLRIDSRLRLSPGYGVDDIELKLMSGASLKGVREVLDVG